MSGSQPILPDRASSDLTTAVASRLSRLRERFADRYDDAQWERIARQVEESVRRGAVLRRFELANHDEPDARFVAARGRGRS